MVRETEPCILEMIEDGTYFDVHPKELIAELIYEDIEDMPLEGIFEVPERLKFDLDYCNTIN